MEIREIVVRTLAAVLLGGLIGMERQKKHRPAGLRTHILVCLGSMTVMLLSELMFIKYYNNYGATVDPARIGAQVISGIGFLGAGTILHNRSNIQGLTTAASLWAVAAVGLAVGAGFYDVAIVVSITLYVTLHMLESIINRFGPKEKRPLKLLLLVAGASGAPESVGTLLRHSGIKIMQMDISNPSFDDEGVPGHEEPMSVTLVLKKGTLDDEADIMRQIAEMEGVLSVDKI